MLRKLTSNTLLYFLCASFCILIGISTPLMAAPYSNLLSPLGINTNEATDMDSSVPFVDLFRLAIPFDQARPWLTKGNILYDKDGWPKNLNGGRAGTRFINNFQQQSIPPGDYTVLYKGEGTIEYGGNAHLLHQSPGRDIISIRGNQKGSITATLTITKSNPANYIRDIQVIMPGGICKKNPFRHILKRKDCGSNGPYLSFAAHAKEIIFNPDYLNFMKDFRVIRMMNMSGVTRNNRIRWEKRPQINQATWGGKEGTRGVPLEIMVKLANLVGTDIWFNLPHRADDDYIRQYATYVSHNLNPKLKAYIEYTNEAWNGIFSQMHYIQQMGFSLGLDKNKQYAGYKFYSKRSVEIFKIWESVFGGHERLVRVMGGMSTNVPLTHLMLGFEDAYKYTDVLAIAPYFFATQAELNRVKNVDDVFRLLLSHANKYSVPNILKVVKRQADAVKKYGVDLVAYEGGQHLVSYGTHRSDEGPNPFLIQANKDDRMSRLYYDFLKGWKKAGGKLFVAFSAPRSYNWIGSWGIKEYITQGVDDAPKYRALLYFQKLNRCWWQRCNRLGSISRKEKPTLNPGKTEMARRFKPRVPEKKIRGTSTTRLIVAANKKREKERALRIRKIRQQQLHDQYVVKMALLKLEQEEERERIRIKNPLFEE